MIILIKDFPNYTINSNGEITSIERRHPRWGTIIKNKPKIMSPSYTGKYRNYLSIRLTGLDGFSKTFKVHRLVASHFIPNPENKPQVNHIDGNPSNNDVSNLEWCTNGENQVHAYSTGLKKNNAGKNNPMFGKQGAYKGKRGDNHNRSTRVVQLDLQGTPLNGFESGMLAAEAVNGNSSNIMKVCKGTLKQSSGFKWCFPTEDHTYLFELATDE